MSFQELRIGTINGPIVSYSLPLPVSYNRIIVAVSVRQGLPLDRIRLVYRGEIFRFNVSEDLDVIFPERNPLVFLITSRFKKRVPSEFGVKEPPPDSEDKKPNTDWTSETDEFGNEIIVID